MTPVKEEKTYVNATVENGEGQNCSAHRRLERTGLSHSRQLVLCFELPGTASTDSNGEKNDNAFAKKRIIG